MLFLEIIAKLKEKRKDIKVFVVGDGNLLNKMKERAKKLLDSQNEFGESIKEILNKHPF